MEMLKRILLSLPLLCACFTVSAQDDKVERGRYLTEEIGKCQDCHTQRSERGELDRAKWMKGAVLVVQPINPIPGWHKNAPDLTPGSALWEGWGEAGLVKFLTTGTGPKGHPADPPMPAYKMKREDAEAMVAYLKSLK
jgi:mono/diheme cytochrome c family protein